MSLPPLTIGTVVIPVPLVVAPMAGVTDRPFRQLCKRLGAGLAVSEMVGAQSLIQGAAKTARRACHSGEVSPRSVQIVGADPALMAQAARINADNGAQIIDINMGCPAKKVCNTLSGSALLRDEPLVAKILEAIVKASPVPVTLKMRTGWDTSSRNGVRIAKLAESLGIQALSIHGRTRCCFYNGDAEYDTIRDIKAAVKIPVIANGDITTPEKALHVLQYTGADGIMIGRGAQGNPWIFREIKHFFDTGTHMPEPSLLEIKETLIEHVEALYEFYGSDRGVHIARKHVSWYSKGQYGSSHFRDHFNRLDSADAQRQALRLYFGQLLDNVAS